MRAPTTAPRTLVAMGRRARAPLCFVAVWSAMAVMVWAVAGGDEARFLNLPLSAYIAGQGAIMALVLVGVRVAGRDFEG